MKHFYVFSNESVDNKQDINKYNRVFSSVSLYIQSFHAAQISSMALSDLSAFRPDAVVRFWQPPRSQKKTRKWNSAPTKADSKKKLH